MHDTHRPCSPPSISFRNNNLTVALFGFRFYSDVRVRFSRSITYFSRAQSEDLVKLTKFCTVPSQQMEKLENDEAASN